MCARTIIHLVEPLGGAAKVENEQGNGEGDEGESRRPPRPRPGQKAGQ